MRTKPFFRNPYLVWFTAVVLIMLLIVRITFWQIDNIRNELHIEMITQSQKLSESINDFFVTHLSNDEINNAEKNYRKYVSQLNMYQVHMDGQDIYGIKTGDISGKIAIAAEIPNAKYSFGDEYPDPGKIYNQTLATKRTQISQPYQVDGQYFITTLTPMIDHESKNIQLIMGIDFPAVEYLNQIKSARKKAFFIVAFIFVVFLLTFSLILWRDKKSAYLRKKFRHLESLATLATALFLTFLALKISEEVAHQERESAFNTVAVPHQKSVKSVFLDIKTKLDVLASFLLNSDTVETYEFNDFAGNIFNDLPIESIYMFSIQKGEQLKLDLFPTDFFGNPQKFLHLDHRYPSYNQAITPVFFSNNARVLQQLMVNAIVHGSTHASESIVDSSMKQLRNLIVLATPLFHHKLDIHQIDKHDPTGILLTIIDPQKIFNKTFRASHWHSEMVNVGLVEMKDLKMHDWLAAFPPEHLEEHQDDRILDHINEFNHSNILPMFVFNKSYGIVAHSTQTLENQYGSFRRLLILLSGTITSIALFVLVMFIRNRWYSLEQIISERTESLKRKINDISCLKNLGDLFQQKHQPETLFQALIEIMKQSCLEGNSNLVFINFKNNEFGTSFKKETATYIQTPLMDDGTEVGFITVGNTNGIYYSKEDKELLQQIGDSINIWLAHYHASIKLKESEEKFHLLIENAFDGIYLLEGRQFRYANKAFLKMLEYENDELLSESFDLDLLLTEKSRAIVQERHLARQSGKQVAPRYEFQQRTKSGKVCDVEVSTISLRLEGKDFVMGILRDISERKIAEKALLESEEKLQQQNEELQVLNEELLVTNNQVREINQDLVLAREKAEASDRIKTAFLNNISHEVRTPLNGIMGASVLISETGLDEMERHELSSIISHSTKRLIRTITQYMDISLLQSGQMTCNSATFELNELIRKLVGDFTQEAIEKKLKLNVVNQLSNEQTFIHSDKELVDKMLTHILDNAVKFTLVGGIELKIEEKYPYIIFTISDTGIGIDTAFQKQVFDYFTQEDSSNLRKYDGSGLGLAICNGIARLLGGSISFNSNKGAGSVFTVKLPMNTDAPLTKAESKGLANEGFQKNIGPVIMIAEDEESNFIVMSMLLQKRLNATIIRAADGEKALDYIKEKHKVDLILMDIKMPVMDGFEATRHIKQLKPHIPIIAITAYGLTGDENKALIAGCDDYMEKPVVTNDLIKKITKYLSDKKDFT